MNTDEDSSLPKHDYVPPESPPLAPPGACPPQEFAGEVTFPGPLGGTKLAASRVCGQLALAAYAAPGLGSGIPAQCQRRTAAAAVPVGHSVALTNQCQPGPPAGQLCLTTAPRCWLHTSAVYYRRGGGCQDHLWPQWQWRRSDTCVASATGNSLTRFAQAFRR